MSITFRKGFKPVILVTGCSSGIGIALAELLKNKTEYRVVITARSSSIKILKDKFKEDDRFWIRSLDVTNPRESLWFEVKPLGINVSMVQPGFVRSKSFLNVKYSEQSRPKSDEDELYRDYYKYMTPFIERLMGLSLTSANDVAKRIFKVIQTENPPLWIPATIDAYFFYYLRRLVPRRILSVILYSALPNVRKWAKAYTNRRKSNF